jgi:type VI secretion system secreted protein VgrG
VVVERFSGREAIDALFDLRVDVLAASSAFDPQALLGEELTLRLLLPDGSSSRAWHGQATHVFALGGDGGLARYRLRLQPWLAALALRRDSFVYAGKNTREIIDEIFADHLRANWRYEVSQALAARPTCVQYRESDLDFVRRLLAQEGLSFRFEHEQGDSGASHSGTPSVAPSRHRLVIFDAQARLQECAPAQVRFHRIDATESSDAISHWSARRQARTQSASLSAWDASMLSAPLGQTRSHLDLGELPTLEHHDGAGAQRFANTQAAQAASERLVAAHESLSKRFDAQGSARQLEPGRRFTLTEHDRYGDQGFTVLSVLHEAANNLGAQAADLLGNAGVEKGSYRNRFEAQRQEVPVMPLWRPKPTAPQAMIARVAGQDDASSGDVHTQRDHRVRVRFHWQSDGEAGAEGDTTLVRAGRRASAAPSVWLRVASAVAGPNWGAHQLPRIGSDVLVSFVDGDIDRPIVSRQLYNAQDLPPWSAGSDSAANHPGVLSGWHSKALDGGGFNQWIADDAPSQVRTRLASSHAASQLNLGHLNAQAPEDASRGQWRGSGAELRSDAWTVVRAGDGLLISSVAQQRANGTALDTASARGQFEAARQAAERLSDAADQAQGLKLAANELLQPLADDLDPEKNGNWGGPVNGQSSKIPRPGSREDGADPAPAFARPLMVLDAANALNWATPASAAVWASQALHWTSQQAGHWAAGQTVGLAAGGSAGLFVHEGGLKVIAQEETVSIEAHTDKLDWQARQDFTVTSSQDAIEVLAKEKVTLKGGQTSIVLDGMNITLTMPATLDIKGTSKAFLGPGRSPAVLAKLPQGAVSIKDPNQSIKYQFFDQHTDAPTGAYRYKLVREDGTIHEGITDEQGWAEQINTSKMQIVKAWIAEFPIDMEDISRGDLI